MGSAVLDGDDRGATFIRRDEALQVPDYWLLQGVFLVTSAGVIFANLLANLAYAWLDPRVRT